MLTLGFLKINPLNGLAFVFVFSFYDAGFILRTQKLSICRKLGYRYHISPSHLFTPVVKAQNRLSVNNRLDSIRLSITQ